MKRLLILTLLSMPAAAAAQALNNSDLDSGPAAKAAAAEPAKPDAEQRTDAVQRPDAPAIMAALSAALRLSSKQEERISAAIKKKTAEFDKLMKEFDRNSAEEKKWRYKMNENQHGMTQIDKDIPDLVRESLDDEQRQAYDKLLEARQKPAAAPEESSAVVASPAAQAAAAGKPVKKRRLVRRKKVKGAAAAAPAPSPAPVAGDEAGSVMVDKDTVPTAQPAEKKPRAPKKRQLTKDAAPAGNQDEGLAGSSPTGKEAPAEDEDAGSYP